MANAANKAAQDLGYASLKPEELQVVAGVLLGHDVLGVLPTGFGKTSCHAVLPSTIDQVYAGSVHCACSIPTDSLVPRPRGRGKTRPGIYCLRLRALRP